MIKLATTDAQERRRVQSSYERSIACPAFDPELGFDFEAWKDEAYARSKVGYAFTVKLIYFHHRDEQWT